MWYSVKDGTHHIPLRDTGYGTNEDGAENACRGNYAIVAGVIGWDEGSQFFGNSDSNIKSEGFNILSITPYYRYSKR